MIARDSSLVGDIHTLGKPFLEHWPKLWVEEKREGFGKNTKKTDGFPYSKAFSLYVMHIVKYENNIFQEVNFLSTLVSWHLTRHIDPNPDE